MRKPHLILTESDTLQAAISGPAASPNTPTPHQGGR